MASRTRDLEDVEILVHIAAPSTTADDARYRQLAQSYLAFEPRSKVDISITKAVQVHGNQGEERGWAPASGQQESRPLSQSFIPESQDLSFDGAIDNCSSPPLRKLPPVLPEGVESSPPKSWEPPPSHVSDSYPMPDARLFHASTERVLEKCFQGFLESTNLGEPASPVPHGDHEPSVELQAQSVHIPSSIPVPDSEDDGSVSIIHNVDSKKIIPVTPMVPGGLTRKRRDAFEAYDQTVIEKTSIPSSAISHVSGSSSHRAESAPPPSSKRTKTGLGEASSATNLLRSSSDMGPARTRPTASPSLSVHDLLEIRPPSPPADVANIEPSDLISEKLSDLARDLSSRYRPKAKRPLDPFERGYWLLDCASWTKETRVEAWQFLTNYLRSGLAGWGVWCRRDVSFSSMRLYCWGHVAKHAYLLLYLASGRHIKATGAEWFGADGEAVLEVTPVER